MPLYSPPTEDMERAVNMAMKSYHTRLADVDLKVDILAARPKTDDAGDPVDEALKSHGYPCLATIKILGPKDRGAGRGDVLLTLDGHRWDELDEAEKLALVDHELTHIELSVDDEGTVKRDDYERPKLSMRLHDHQFGWFDEVLKRHGHQSQELQQFETFRLHRGQLFFDFAEQAHA